jgi:hypothetical protein
VGLPAFLELGTPWLWVALGVTSVAPGLAWWGAVLFVIVAGSMPVFRERPSRDVLHPLAPPGIPWPEFRGT